MPSPAAGPPLLEGRETAGLPCDPQDVRYRTRRPELAPPSACSLPASAFILLSESLGGSRSRPSCRPPNRVSPATRLRLTLSSGCLPAELPITMHAVPRPQVLRDHVVFAIPRLRATGTLSIATPVIRARRQVHYSNHRRPATGLSARICCRRFDTVRSPNSSPSRFRPDRC